MHVDPLDAAAALAGVVERAVDQLLDSRVEVGVGAHIGRVLAAELEADADEGAGRRALDPAAAATEPVKLMKSNAPAISREVCSWRGTGSEEAVGKAGRQGLGEPLAGESSGRVLEHDGVARDQRRDDGVDRREKGIVPGRDDQHEAERLAGDKRRKPVAVLENPGRLSSAIAAM